MSFATLALLRRVATQSSLVAVTNRQLPLTFLPATSSKQTTPKTLAPLYKLSESLIVTRRLSEDDIVCRVLHLNCSSINKEEPAKNKTGSGDNDNLPEDILREIKEALCRSTQQFFTARVNINMFHPNIVFENRINGKVSQGLGPYNQYLGMAKIYGHLRYSFVSSQVLSSHIDQDQCTVSVRFQFLGMGMIEMALKYFPKKLYQRAKLTKESRVWLDAISTFHLDDNGIIIKHVLDNKDLDRERLVQTPVEKVKEKLRKLNPSTPSPSAI
jgi:hypothetical protein